MALRRMADKVAFHCNLEFPSCRLCISLWILHSNHEVNMIKGSFFQLLWLTRSFPIESRLLSSDIVIPALNFIRRLKFRLVISIDSFNNIQLFPEIFICDAYSRVFNASDT